MDINGFVTSVYKNEILTKEAYTEKWAELISILEKHKAGELATNE